MASLLKSLKLFLISTALFFTAMGLNVSFSIITQFMPTQVPLPLTWLKLKPPYLFLLLNAIIITIAATSKLHHPHPTSSAHLPPPEEELELEPPAEVDVKALVVNGVDYSDEDDGTVTEETENSPTMDDVWKAITERRTPAVFLRRELSQDELNRRVEAFISKFNADVKLQKQESLNRYMEIGNGTLTVLPESQNIFKN